MSSSSPSGFILRINTEKKSFQHLHHIYRLSSLLGVPKLLRKGCKIRDRKANVGRNLSESCCVVTGPCTGEILFVFNVGRQLCESCFAVTGVCTGEDSLLSDVQKLCGSCLWSTSAPSLRSKMSKTTMMLLSFNE